MEAWEYDQEVIEVARPHLGIAELEQAPTGDLELQHAPSSLPIKINMLKGVNRFVERIKEPINTVLSINRHP
eukprot:5122817-Pyramimonas_sp.AAC.2